MSDRFIKFNDEQLDAKQVMMLQDLARLLLKNEQTQVKIQKFPYYNPVQNVLITSWFWSHRPSHIEMAGLKTDVMLAAYGYHMMDVQIVNEVVQDKTFKHPKFYQQLFKLLEDMRVLNSIKVERPSTAKLIDLRLDTRIAGQVGLNAQDNGVFVEDKDSPYVNIIVARTDNKDSKAIQDFVKAYQTEEVYQEAKKHFKDGVVKGW